MDDERGDADGRQARATISADRDCGDLPCRAGRIISASDFFQGEETMRVLVEGLPCPRQSGAREGCPVGKESGLVRHGIGRRPGLPVLDMIDVYDSTQSGCSLAMICAIMPPMDRPATCARRIRAALLGRVRTAAFGYSRGRLNDRNSWQS
jgi:hypothetical protein